MSLSIQPNTTLRGRAAEAAACVYLAGLGFKIIDRNFRGGHGEIDIIAWDEGVLVFVEVRARNNEDHGTPLETITPQKVSRVISAARIYLEDRLGIEHRGAWPRMRFDAVGVLGYPPEFTHLREAFET